MVFIETTLFTSQLTTYLSDSEYGELQHFLMETPDAGALIQGTGGLRKLRWDVANKGKRGGVRIIYYWHKAEHHLYMMTMYAKNEVTDLSAQEKKALKQMLERWVL